MEKNMVVGKEDGNKQKPIGVTKNMMEDVFRKNSHLFTPKRMDDINDVDIDDVDMIFGVDDEYNLYG